MKTYQQSGSEFQMGGRTYLVDTVCDNCGEPVDLRLGTYEVWRRCACVRKEDAKRKQMSMIKKGIVDDTFPTMRFELDSQYDPVASRKARNYAKHWDAMFESNTGLLFTGGVGTGKTFYAGCIANYLLDKGKNVLFTSLGHVISTEFAEYGNMLRYIQEAELVIFDDVGAERDTSFAWERAFDAIDRRVRSNKPMIITTNFSVREMAMAELREKRVYDRILGACEIVVFSGTSVRPKEKKKKADALKLLDA